MALNKKNTFDSALLYKTSIIGMVFLVITYIIAILSKPVISPEIGMTYLMVDVIQTIEQALNKFAEFNETWYRPFTFYLTSFFIFQLIDIDNIHLIKIIAFLIILFNSFIVTELAKKIFNSGIVERIIIFSLVVSHPLYYNVAYEGYGITEPIFNIFINITIICFLRILENINSKISIIPPKDSDSHKTALAFLCCLFITLTVLSHERGLAIFAMIGVLYLFYNWKSILNKKVIPKKSTLVVLIFSIFILPYTLF